MAEAFIVAFDIQEEGTGGTGVKAKAGQKFKKGELLPDVIEMVTGAFLSVNGAKLCAVEAENVEEACKIVGEAYGNRGGVAGGCKKSSWEFKSA